MPFPGVRVNQQTTRCSRRHVFTRFPRRTGSSTDTTKPNGRIWAGVVGNVLERARDQRNQRFVVWLGTGKDPIDQAAAKTLADSIRHIHPPLAKRRSERGPAATNAPPPVQGGLPRWGVPFRWRHRSRK